MLEHCMDHSHAVAITTEMHRTMFVDTQVVMGVACALRYVFLCSCEQITTSTHGVYSRVDMVMCLAWPTVTLVWTSLSVERLI